jgi:hypothetical protein
MWLGGPPTSWQCMLAAPLLLLHAAVSAFAPQALQDVPQVREWHTRVAQSVTPSGSTTQRLACCMMPPCRDDDEGESVAEAPLGAHSPNSLSSHAVGSR